MDKNISRKKNVFFFNTLFKCFTDLQIYIYYANNNDFPLQRKKINYSFFFFWILQRNYLNNLSWNHRYILTSFLFFFIIFIYFVLFTILLRIFSNGRIFYLTDKKYIRNLWGFGCWEFIVLNLFLGLRLKN